MRMGRSCWGRFAYSENRFNGCKDGHDDGVGLHKMISLDDDIRVVNVATHLPQSLFEDIDIMARSDTSSDLQ